MVTWLIVLLASVGYVLSGILTGAVMAHSAMAEAREKDWSREHTIQAAVTEFLWAFFLNPLVLAIGIFWLFFSAIEKIGEGLMLLVRAVIGILIPDLRKLMREEKLESAARELHP